MVDPPRPSIVALIGQVLDGRYQILSLIGEGGMGAVYRARQPNGPDVAIKVLHEELIDDPDLKERFEREARALFALEHPHVLGVHDFGIVSGSPYLVMELLEGMSLDQYIEEVPIDPETALAVARQVLTGLAFAHSKSIVHRDLKTENIFVSFEPGGGKTAKLLDFGLVKFTDDERWGSAKKLTMAGSVMGTPAYMSPEQVSGAPTDARGDVYAAGVILCELLTGLWPFMEESRLAMFQAHIGRPPPPLNELSDTHEFHPALESIYQKAMAKKPDERFQNGSAMLAALEALPSPAAWPKGTPMPASATSGGTASAQKPGVLAAAAVGVLVVLGVLAYFLLS